MRTIWIHINYQALQANAEKRILETFERATSNQIAEGTVWYPNATLTLQRLIPDSVYDLQRASAVCAILSPRISWQSNLEGVRRIYQAVQQGNRVPPRVAGIRRNVDKAWRVANGDSLELATGCKVSSFYANLAGDYQRVTIDVWSARVAGIDPDQLKAKRYTALELAYRTIAGKLSIEPAFLQAITWIVVRGKGE